MDSLELAGELGAKAGQEGADCSGLVGGLGEVVGEQDAVVQRVADRVVRRRGREEVGRDELRALVHELVERMLAVRSGGTPDDRL